MPAMGTEIFALAWHQERIQKRRQAALSFCRGINDEQAKVRGDEFVAAAACVELPAERAEFFDEGFLDEVVNVFRTCAERIDPRQVRSRAFGNFVECGERLLHFRGGENANGLERLRPRAVHGNFVGQETAIERKGALERVEVSVWLTLEASAPQPVIFAFGHWCNLVFIEEISSRKKREMVKRSRSARNDRLRNSLRLSLWAGRLLATQRD